MLSNRSIPPSTVIPTLAYPDVNTAAEWLCRAFGFTVRIRIFEHRIQLNVGDGAIVVTDGGNGSASADHTIMIRVENIDEHFARARAAGAVVVAEPQTHIFGERQYTVLDHVGHRWAFSQSVADVNPADWGGVAEKL